MRILYFVRYVMSLWSLETGLIALLILAVVAGSAWAGVMWHPLYFVVTVVSFIFFQIYIAALGPTY